MVTLRVSSIVWFATTVVLSILATLLVTQAWHVSAAPGDADSTFVPVPPCRLFDMRQGEPPDFGKKTPLAAGEGNVHTQQVTGNVGNCVGIPSEATAVSMNVTIVSPTAQSNLRVFPANVPTPTASNLNWLPGQSPTPNKVDVKLSSDGKIKLYNHAGTVNVLADVVGYYTNSTLQELASTVADLKASQPFSVSAYSPLGETLSTSPKSYLDLPVTAPVDGQVTVNYSTYIWNSDAGGRSVCAPLRLAPINPIDISNTVEGVGFWETSAPFNGNEGSVSGTASFDIAGGTTVTYSLVCELRVGSGSTRGRSMTATFTPAP